MKPYYAQMYNIIKPLSYTPMHTHTVRKSKHGA